MKVDYYDKKRMSATTFKRYLECPAAAHYEPQIDSESLRIGAEVDNRLLLNKVTPFLTPKTGKPSAKETQIAEMVERARRSERFMASLEGDHQVEIEFELDGVEWKCKLDNFNKEKHFVTDLKTTKDFKEIYNTKTSLYEKPWVYWGYDIQMAIYCYATKRRKAYLSFISKKDMDLKVIKVPEEVLRAAMHEKILPNNKIIAEQYYEGKNLWRCGKCDYCISTRTDEELIGDWYEG